MDTTTHARLIAALTGQRLLSEVIAEHQAKPKDLHETRDPLRGRPVPAGTHQLLVEALGGCVAVRLPEGIHVRLGRTLVG